MIDEYESPDYKKSEQMIKEIASGARGKNRNARLKAIAFCAFVIAAVVVVRFTPAAHYLTTKTPGQFLREAGLWAPLLFVAIYAAGVCLLMPGTLLTGPGALVFGPYRGFVYAWCGAMLGANASFVIGRTFGRDFAASLIGRKLKKYDDAIERNGFATVLYLRIIYLPFTPMNFGMGLTKVRFRDYFLGTALGIVVGTFVFTFFVGTLKEVWTSGNWGQLLTPQVFISLGLFALSFSIPYIVKKLKGEV